MKKSICLFLLMLAATFQVAFAQEEPLNPDPCTVMEKPIEIFGAFTSEKCPDCLFAWVGSYDENQASAIQILSFEIIPNDNVNKEVCEGCLTASEIVQMAFVDMMFRLRKMGVWSERITQTSAYLKPCWFKTYTEVSDEYYQEKLSLAAQNEVVEKTPIAEKKSGEEIQGASNHTSIKFFFCPSYDVCCFSKIKVGTVYRR